MFGFEDLGATLTIGAYFIAGLVLILDWLFHTRLFSRIRGELRENPAGRVILLLVLSYASGILIENTSDYVVGKEREAFWPRSALMWWVPSEKELKALVLYDPKKQRTKGLGRELARAGFFSRYAGEEYSFIEQQLLSNPDSVDFKNDLVPAAASIYYKAKNRVFQEDNYFNELTDIQRRVDFVRSLALASAYLLLVMVLVTLLRLICPGLPEWIHKRLRITRWPIFWVALAPDRPTITLRFFVLAISLSLVYLLALFSYQYEEIQFNKRAYGYFISLEPKPNMPLDIRASGMVRLDANHYLVVNDTKADKSGPRVGLLWLAAIGPPHYRELALNWQESGGPASDLESICAVPGRAGEFLAAESGYSRNKYGRLFHLEVIKDPTGVWKGRILKRLQLPELEDEIEGIACTRAPDGEMILMVGERGTKEKQGRLSWGVLRLDAHLSAFKERGEIWFTAPRLPPSTDTRDCSDLYLDPSGRLWVAATTDSGDRGPFRSVIFQLGTIDPKSEHPIKRNEVLEAIWVLDGLKVESVAAAPRNPFALSFATDDECYGGIWRPLFPPDG